MKSKQIIDSIIQYVEQKGIVLDETLLRRAQLFDLFNVSKAKLLSDYIYNDKQVSDTNYLESVIDRIEYEEGSPYSYFEIANSIMGYVDYVGGTDGCSRFREMDSIMQEQSTVNLQVPSITTYRRKNNFLAVKNNGVGTILVSYIPVNPMEVPTFNFDMDDYPVDAALLNTIFDVMFATYQSKTQQSAKDTVSDSQDTVKSIVK